MSENVFGRSRDLPTTSCTSLASPTAASLFTRRCIVSSSMVDRHPWCAISAVLHLDRWLERCQYLRAPLKDCSIVTSRDRFWKRGCVRTHVCANWVYKDHSSFQGVADLRSRRSFPLPVGCGITSTITCRWRKKGHSEVVGGQLRSWSSCDDSRKFVRQVKTVSGLVAAFVLARVALLSALPVPGAPRSLSVPTSATPSLRMALSCICWRKSLQGGECGPDPICNLHREG